MNIREESMKRAAIAGLSAGTISCASPALAQTALSDVSQATQAYKVAVDGAARTPDGFTQVATKLSACRKLGPTPFVRTIFLDQPPGRPRTETAMRWKAEHLGEPGVE